MFFYTNDVKKKKKMVTIQNPFIPWGPTARLVNVAQKVAPVYPL